MKAYLLSSLLFSVALTAFAAEPSFFQLHSVADAPGETTKPYSYQYRNNPPETLHLISPALMDGRAVKSAKVERGQNGQPEILVTFTSEGAKQFADATTKHVGKRIAILLGGKIHTVPTVNEPIRGGSAVITGNLTEDEAAELAKKLNATAGE